MPDEALHRTVAKAHVTPAVGSRARAGECDGGWVRVDPDDATCQRRSSQSQAAVARADIQESNTTEAVGSAEPAELPHAVWSVRGAAAGAVDKTRHAPTL